MTINNHRNFRILAGVIVDLSTLVGRFLFSLVPGAKGGSPRRFLGSLYRHLKSMKRESDEFFDETDDQFHARFFRQTKGFHSLIDSKLFFSILLVADGSSEEIKRTLISALNQTAPVDRFEVVVAYAPDLSSDSVAQLNKIKNQCSKKNISIKIVLVSNDKKITWNNLSLHAQFDQIILVRSGDWLRPDLILRYTQAIEAKPNLSDHVLYCNDYAIETSGKALDWTFLEKPMSPSFPYYFCGYIGFGISFPKRLFNLAGEVHGTSYDSICDLVIRLLKSKVSFSNVPIYLYGRHERFLNEYRSCSREVLRLLLAHEGTDFWETIDSRESGQYFRPKYNSVGSIHVIVLFKNRKEFTIEAVKSVMNQAGVQVKVTAVDNGSEDRSIAQDLESLGVEVLSSSAPFSFSMLNNWAVQESKFRDSCDGILFLNNDAFLRSDALKEMSIWLSRPDVGIVGCKLYYPDGTIQHGGFELGRQRRSDRLDWALSNRLNSSSEAFESNFVRVVDGVTAACMLIKTRVFKDIDGFDERYYPIAFSDTDLCARVSKLGLKVLYTPFAEGVHHESVSREKNMIEDFEASTWLFEQRVGPCLISESQKLGFIQGETTLRPVGAIFDR